MRRKGIPGDCCGDTCGNKVRKINGISPDPNGEFSIEAGDGIAFTEITNGFKVDVQGDVDIISAGENIDIDDQGDEKVISLTNEIVGDHLIKNRLTLDTGNSGSTNYASLDMNMPGVRGSRPASTYGAWIRMSDANGQNEGLISYRHVNLPADTRELSISAQTGTSVPTGELKIVVNPQANESHLEGSARAYDANNESDIVTIKTMKDNAVTIADAQTITGLKTFTEIAPFDMIQNAGRNDIIQYADSTKAVRTNMIRINQSASENSIGLHCFQPGNNSYQAPAISGHFSTNEVWGESLSRSYNSAHTSDIVTIGSLAANPSVVHTVGNESINGTKTFTSALTKKSDYDQYGNNTAVNLFDNASTNRILGLFINKQSNGIRVLYASIMNSDNSTYTNIELGRST